MNVLNNFQEIEIESPVDKIIRQIRELIITKQLNSGDKLPSERKLAQRLRVGRSNVRDAIKKLEFYGILKTLPQSGTVVAGIGITALEGLISDVLKIENTDFASLVEARVLLEIEATRLAAQRRTDDNIKAIRQALVAHRTKVTAGDPAVEEDLMFHIKIAEASQNTVLKSLMLIITPDIIKNFIQLDICKDRRSDEALKDHEEILKYIIAGDGDNAAAAMMVHLRDVFDYSQKIKLNAKQDAS